MILERIKQYIDSKGISVAAFERSVGMSNASFGKCLKNKGGIGTDKLENILSKYPDISPIWLLTGVGDMIAGATPDNPHNEEIEALKAKNEVLKAKNEVLKEELSEAKEKNSEQLKELAKQNGELSTKAADAEKYYNTIIEQAKTIGRLEAKVEELDDIRAQLAEARRKIETLKIEIGKNATTHSHASTPAPAVP